MSSTQLLKNITTVKWQFTVYPAQREPSVRCLYVF